MRIVLGLAALLAVSCTNLPSWARAVSSQSQAGASINDFEEALLKGEVSYEVRGLQVEAKNQASFTTFTHRATVIARGPEHLAKRPHMVLFLVRRISGGDPDVIRPAHSRAVVYMLDGIGELSEYGGLMTPAEKRKWSQEVIELKPVAVYPMVPIKGESVRENQ